MTDDDLHGVVIDSGPIIGAMYEEDDHHSTAERGFRQLEAAHAQIVVPVPVVFEVYKRLAYDVGPALARRGLYYMQTSLTLVYFGPDELEILQHITDSMPWWGGSLEDAAVAMVGLARQMPAWTFNYRDLRAFPNLQFWTPG
jgi:predicted nucleic acid-binding protein